jgi:hypothetical protein
MENERILPYLTDYIQPYNKFGLRVALLKNTCQ